MNKENKTEIELKAQWLAEEKIAHIHGWDFSHIKGRYTEASSLPWSYKELIQSYLQSNHMLLDIDTGGGEFLLTLEHPYHLTSATEGYPPNVRLCEDTLTPLGIHFREMTDYANMPFADNSFDMIINRHGDYNIAELYRTLKPGGIFITQQVGEDNDRELVELLLPSTPKPFPGWNLANQVSLLAEHGFHIRKQQEAFQPICFYDVSALVWFARIIQWEFPGFSVEKCFDQLMEAQLLLKKNGSISGTTHRFVIVAQK